MQRLLPDASLPPHLRTGILGEDTASRFLRSLGYRILERNVRLGKDEIDIVAFDPEDQVIVFAEVKTRSRDDGYAPELQVDWRKRKNIRRSARGWVHQQQFEGGYRLDLLCIVGDAVTLHLKELPWSEGA